MMLLNEGDLWQAHLVTAVAMACSHMIENWAFGNQLATTMVTASLVKWPPFATFPQVSHKQSKWGNQQEVMSHSYSCCFLSTHPPMLHSTCPWHLPTHPPTYPISLTCSFHHGCSLEIPASSHLMISEGHHLMVHVVLGWWYQLGLSKLPSLNYVATQLCTLWLHCLVLEILLPIAVVNSRTTCIIIWIKGVPVLDVFIDFYLCKGYLFVVLVTHLSSLCPSSVLSTLPPLSRFCQQPSLIQSLWDSICRILFYLWKRAEILTTDYSGN